MSRLVALAVLTSFVACAAHAEPPANFQWQGSPEGYEHAKAAIDEWNRTCGLALTLEGGDIPITEVSEFRSPEPPETLGYTWVNGRSIEIEIRIPGGRATIAHEIGHAMGASHAPDGIMRERPGQGHVTPADCARLR